MPTEPTVEIVMFSAAGLNFGTYAGQIAEILPAQRQPATSRHGWCDCLGRGEPCRALDFAYWLERHACSARTSGSRPASKVLVLASPATRRQGILVDYVEDVADVAFEHLAPLPILVRRLCRISALWGIADYADTLRMLVDLERLLTVSEADGRMLS